jgi:hypothetical protein
MLNMPEVSGVHLHQHKQEGVKDARLHSFALQWQKGPTLQALMQIF